MRFLLAFAFRLFLLALFTFGFVVLFEHGPAKFHDGVKTQWNALVVRVGALLSRQTSAPVAPQPAATGSASPAPKQPASAGSHTNKLPPATPTITR